MAPSLRQIRQALTRKRKAEGNRAPSERRAVAKIARRAQAERIQATEPSSEEAARSKTASDARDEVAQADASERLRQSEERGEDRPHPPSPVPPPPTVIAVDTSPVRDVEVPPPGAMEAEPECSVTRPTPGTVPPRGAENRGPPSAGVPNERESVAGPSVAATESLEGGVPDHSLQTILRCSRWAEETLNLASVPEIQGFLQQQKMSTFFREASVAHLWALNSLTAMKGLWAASDTALDQASEEMAALRSRAERAEMALEDTRATTVRAMQNEVETARLRAERMEEALDVAKRQAANELDNAQVAEEKQKVAEEKLKTAESKIYLLTNRLHSANIEIGVAGERAENAEEIARRSEARVAELEAALAEAERKAKEAGEKAAEAERRALTAVEEFRKSAAYNKELAESTALAYEGGFQECKVKVQRLYSLEGIKDLEPDEVSEDDDSTPHAH